VPLDPHATVDWSAIGTHHGYGTHPAGERPVGATPTTGD